MIKKTSNNVARLVRHGRIAKRLKGNAERPRLCVFRSLKSLYVQVINDDEGKVLLSLSMLSKVFKEKVEKVGLNKANATLLGKMVGDECLSKGIKQVLFDRNGYKFHGRIEALATAAREAGLSF